MQRKPKGELRRGWTTGACAAAASRAAYQALLTGKFPDPVEIRLPKGESPRFALAERVLGPDCAMAAVVKDAGDDPDVSHGALVRATLRHGPTGSGVTFRAGEGVGTVTLDGLPLPVGEPAINPGPRGMIQDAIAEVARAEGSSGDAEVEIAIPGGEALAAKTLNGRLGIKGGLSVLGTTGVVIPYSCSSWIHSIHRGIDVARALGLTHVAAATGSTSEAAVQRLYGLPEQALLDMGDFAGGLLKYLRRHPIPRLTLAGGFAKLAKLAAGHLDLHSSRSRLEPAWLARQFVALGAEQTVVAALPKDVTGAQALEIARQAALPLANHVADLAQRRAVKLLGPAVGVEVLIFDRSANLIGRSRR